MTSTKKMHGEVGSPKKFIDWDIIDKILIAGCSGVQAACAVGVHANTLYDRCQVDHGMLFTDYRENLREKGNSFLHQKQFELAMQKDRCMLIWLGKQRLNQRDAPKEEITFGGELKSYIDFLKAKYSNIETDEKNHDTDEKNHDTDEKNQETEEKS